MFAIRSLDSCPEDLFGSPTECFRKGYGLGYNASIDNVASFLAEWGGRYKPYIQQQLYYGDGATPPGYQRATLSQSLSRGYALGRVAKAQKMMRASKSNVQTHQLPSRSIVRSQKWASNHANQ